MKGASQVEFTALLLILCIAVAIAWPYLSLSSNATAEARAVNMLKAIHVAQNDFFAGRRYYGSEQQLREFGVLGGVDLQPANNLAAVGVGTSVTYSFDITLSGGRTSYCVTAIPTPKGRYIAIDESGKIHMDRTCQAGSIR